MLGVLWYLLIVFYPQFDLAPETDLVSLRCWLAYLYCMKLRLRSALLILE